MEEVRGTVFTWTVNHHPFHPHVPTPYVIAIVELDGTEPGEPAARRVVGNVVGCDPDDVHIGMAVEAADVDAGGGEARHFRPAAR